MQSPHFPKPHRSPKILKAIALLRRIIPPRKYPSPSFHGAASIPCNLGSHQSPATWIRINRPNHLNMILPLHPSGSQTAPLVPRSAECLQGTRAPPLQGKPFSRGAVPKHTNTSSGNPGNRPKSSFLCQPWNGRRSGMECSGNPFKWSFLCSGMVAVLEWSPFWNGRCSTKLPLERVVMEWNGVVSFWRSGAVLESFFLESFFLKWYEIFHGSLWDGSLWNHSLWYLVDCFFWDGFLWMLEWFQAFGIIWNGFLWMLECQGCSTGVFVASSCRYGDGLESFPKDTLKSFPRDTLESFSRDTLEW